jgi:hypothetical protein
MHCFNMNISSLTPLEVEISEWAEKTAFNKISKWKYIVGGTSSVNSDLSSFYLGFIAIDSNTLHFLNRISLSKYLRKIRKTDILPLATYRTGRGTMQGSRHIYPLSNQYNESKFTSIIWDRESRFYVGDTLGAGYYVFDLKKNEGWFHSFFGDEKLTKVLLIDDTNLYFSDVNHNLFKVSIVDRSPKLLGKFPVLLEAQFTEGRLSMAKVASKFYICHPSNPQIYTFCEIRGFEPVSNVAFASPIALQKDKCSGLLVLDRFGVHRIDLINFLKISLPQFVNHPKMNVKGLDLQVDNEGNIYISTKDKIVYKERDRKPRIVPEDNYYTTAGQKIIMCLENQWPRLRLLWIGKLKESWKTCYLALLPREIVKEIIAFI